MEALQQYLPYFPYAIMAFVIGAGVILLKALQSYSTMIYRAKSLKSSLKSPLSLFESSSITADEEKPSMQERLKEWLVSLGLISDNDSLSRSFHNALKILDQHFGGRDFAYKIPWFLLLGAPGSGKSSIVESVELDLPIGLPEYETEDSRPPLKWWFFNGGIVLDVIGDYILPAIGGKTNERGWSRLLMLLSANRPRRPIDGVVLTIPASELAGINALSHDEIVSKAKQINTKLWHLQNSLSMKVPIYIVITKMDTIDGFRSFAQEVPQSTLMNMFGWSVPYSLEATYNKQWPIDFFMFVKKSLQKIRAEIFAAGNVKINRDGAFIFRKEISKIEQSFTTYLDNIFQESSYHESFFLRGIYFSGDAGVHSAVEDMRRQERFWVSPSAIGGIQENPFATQDHLRIAFLRDLFEKKVFREFALAKPVKRVLVSANKYINIAKILMASFLVAWVGSLYIANQELSQGRDQLRILMSEIDQTIHNVKRKDFNFSNVHDANYLNTETLKIIGLMSDLSINSSFLLQIPTSWWSSYDDDIQLALTAAWNEVILKSMFTGLQERARRLFLPVTESSQSSNRPASINPLTIPQYLVYSEYVYDVQKWEHFAKLYNQLEQSDSIDDVAKLITYLYKIDLPSAFYENSQYYQDALVTATEKKISLKDFEASAQKKAKVLYGSFLLAAFDLKQGLGNMETFSSALESLSISSSSFHQDEQVLRENIKIIFALAELLTDSGFKWIENDSFNPGQELSETNNAVAISALLGVNLANEMVNISNKAFLKYKHDLANLSAPLIGSILYREADTVKAQPSNTFAELILGLSDFMRQPFMQAQKNFKNFSSIIPGKILFWDEGVLGDAANIADGFENYISTNLQNLSPQIRQILMGIGRSGLRNRIFDRIARAQTFQVSPKSLTGFAEQEALRTQVQNLKSVSPIMRKILGGYLSSDTSSQATALRELLSNYAINMLQAADAMLTRDDLYGLGSDSFEWWDGQDMLGLRAFGVYDVDDMRQYLNTQAERIGFLGTDIAEPVLSFLDLPFLSNIQKKRNLVTKWTRIATQLDAHNKQLPGNSVTLLENFLIYDLNQVTRDSCVELLEAPDVYEKHNDYFLEKMGEIRHSMVNRCRVLAQNGAKAEYIKLSSFFNRYLAGRFPFCDEAEAWNAPDASADDINTFLTMFAELNQQEFEALNSMIDPVGIDQSPTLFLAAIKSIEPLLKAALNGDMDQAEAKLGLQVDFRVNRAQESGGDKIIDWILEVDGVPITNWQSDKKGSWRVGSQVRAILRWAKDSGVAPMNDPGQNMMTIEGESAVFTYTGRWSLIRLIKHHGIVSSKAPGATPILLEFKVPTVTLKLDEGSIREPEMGATVFYGLSLMSSVPTVSPDGKKSDSASAIQMPQFPTRAPILSDRFPTRMNR